MPTSCMISASTDSSTTIFFAGEYGCAVWIGTPANALVKTLAFASKVSGRTKLPTYRGIAGDKPPDVTTSATFRSPQELQYTWDLKDLQGSAVAPGKFVLNVEVYSTWGDTTVTVPFDLSQGPVSESMMLSGEVKSASITCN